MIKCYNCEKLNDDKFSYCEYCGFKLTEPELFCPNCEYESDNIHALYCGNCGTKLIKKSEHGKWIIKNYGTDSDEYETWIKKYRKDTEEYKTWIINKYGEKSIEYRDLIINKYGEDSKEYETWIINKYGEKSIEYKNWIIKKYGKKEYINRFYK